MAEGFEYESNVIPVTQEQFEQNGNKHIDLDYLLGEDRERQSEQELIRQEINKARRNIIPRKY